MEKVIITREEALSLRYNEYGITSGKKDATTGLRPTIYFTLTHIFDKNFKREKEFITI